MLVLPQRPLPFVLAVGLVAPAALDPEEVAAAFEVVGPVSDRDSASLALFRRADHLVADSAFAEQDRQDSVKASVVAAVYQQALADHHHSSPAVSAGH